jgi:integrase
MGVRVRFHRGTWWVFVAHHGKRKSKRVGDKDTAQTVAKAIRERLALGDLSLLGSTSDTFQVYADRWLQDGEKARKASTQRFYRVTLALYVTPTMGPLQVGSITRAHCRQLMTACREKKLKVSTVYGIQRTLSAVLTQAVEDGILKANPAFRMGRYIRRGDEPRPAITPLTRLEAERFLITLQTDFPDYHAFFLMALRTGMRLGELLAVQWGDLDLVERFVEVQRNLVSGKITTPKNHQRRRVDLSAKLTEALERRLTAAKAAALKAGEPMPAWVFPNRDGGPLDADNLRRRVFEKALKKALLRHVRIHDLRHTFASHLIQNGESLAYVRDQMGHASITLTVDTYGHLVPGSNRAAVDRLDATSGSSRAASGTKNAKSKTAAK